MAFSYSENRQIWAIKITITAELKLKSVPAQDGQVVASSGQGRGGTRPPCPPIPTPMLWLVLRQQNVLTDSRPVQLKDRIGSTIEPVLLVRQQ